MQLTRGWQGLASACELHSVTGGAVTIGSFDGLHRGHAALIERCVAAARACGGPSTLVTFEPHPRAVLSPGSEPLRISRWSDRLPVLEAMGLDRVVVLRFDASMAAMTPDAFVQRLLVDALAARHVVVGGDFRFGHKAAGDVSRLAELGRNAGFEVALLPDLEQGGARISSSAVREALQAGVLDRAGELLGRPFSVLGRVVYGEQIGRQLGYRTANLALGGWQPPVSGVFAVRVRADREHGRPRCASHGSVAAGGLSADPAPGTPADGALGGMANVGMRPTVGGLRRLLEVHLFDYSGDLYGRRLSVEFVAKLRPEQRFDGLEALKAQLGRDAVAARAALGL